MVDFIVYQGASTELSDKEFGLGPSVVLTLIRSIPRGSTLYFDRYFTTIPLLLHLKSKKFLATGTVMSNRIQKIPLTSDKELKERGQMDEMVAGGIAAVKMARRRP